MRSRVFLGGLAIVFFMEAAAFWLFAAQKTEYVQNTVAVNEVLQTVQNNWENIQEHKNNTNLAYVVLDNDGAVLYRTKTGLSESINAAVSHKDTVMDVQDAGMIAGKIIIYNEDAVLFQAEKKRMMFAAAAAIVLQFVVCAAYFLYLRHTIMQPFQKLKNFAQRVAGGNLDIPLEMDQQNLFGAFTESFDIMRSELKKAKIAEAKANADKKELVAKLSHDIKTPVASIQAASEVGAALASDEKIRKNYRQIIQKTDQINTLVTNLFSAALEELQELTVMPSDMKSGQLRTLLENADYLHRAVIPPVPECLLYADKIRLQQVFDNIFANSYKYADTNINVTIAMQECGIAVCIEDYGGGVKDSELPLLKEKFQRGSSAENKEGAGLGLYISDYCMRQMRGRLHMENGAAGLKVTVCIAFSKTF